VTPRSEYLHVCVRACVGERDSERVEREWGRGQTAPASARSTGFRGSPPEGEVVAMQRGGQGWHALWKRLGVWNQLAGDGVSANDNACNRRQPTSTHNKQQTLCKGPNSTLS
jgi:hypothetical protein